MKEFWHRFLLLGAIFIASFGLFFLVKYFQNKNNEPFSNQVSEQKHLGTVHKKEALTLEEDLPFPLEDVALLARLDEEYIRLVKAVTPSVVSIYTPDVKRELIRDSFGRIYQGRLFQTQGIGSGVIVSPQGHVITNHHVVKGKGRYLVTLHDGKTYEAFLIGSDGALDVSVIRIKANGPFKAIKFGDSDQVEVGQKVFAVGNAFGLGESVTWGNISAKERSLTDTQSDLFQTDTVINPGNSGGPLVNLRGEMIGVNVAIYSPDKKNKGFHGVSFSIPSNAVKDSFLAIVEQGRPIRGYLGVIVRDVIPQIRQILKYQGQGGAVIDTVTTGSPAEAAGIQARDVIESYNGKNIRSREHLLYLIQRSKVDEQVNLRVWRAGTYLNLVATIKDQESSLTRLRQEQAPSATDQDILKQVGAQVRDLSVLERVRGGQGVLVIQVFPKTLVSSYGLKKGDLIVDVNGVRVNESNDFYSRLVASVPIKKTKLLIIRDGKISRIELPRLYVKKKR